MNGFKRTIWVLIRENYEHGDAKKRVYPELF